MKKYTLFTLIGLSFFFADAQLIDLDNLARKTERQVQRRIERGANRTVNDGLDKAEDAVTGKNKKKYEDDVYYESETFKESSLEELPQNSFVGQVSCAITLESVTGDFITLNFRYISDDYSSILIPKGEKYDNIDFIYVHNKNKSITTAQTINGEKVGTKDWFKHYDLDGDERAQSERTSETAVLNDFICRKYVLETERSQVENWVSAEFEFQYDKFLMILNYLELIPNNLLEINPETKAVIESNIDLASKESISIELKDIQEGHYDFSNYDISEYRLLDYTEY